MHHQQKHIIDVIFVLALFAMFAFSALVLVIIGANIYNGVVERMDSNYISRTESSYIIEKIRSADEEGRISLASFNGRDAIVIEDTVSDRTLCTYLYEYEGSLCELYTDPAYGLSPEGGDAVLPISSFSLTETAPGLVRIAFQDDSHTDICLYVHIVTNE